MTSELMEVVLAGTFHLGCDVPFSFIGRFGRSGQAGFRRQSLTDFMFRHTNLCNGQKVIIIKNIASTGHFETPWKNFLTMRKLLRLYMFCMLCQAPRTYFNTFASPRINIPKGGPMYKGPPLYYETRSGSVQPEISYNKARKNKGPLLWTSFLTFRTVSILCISACIKSMGSPIHFFCNWVPEPLHIRL